MSVGRRDPTLIEQRDLPDVDAAEPTLRAVRTSLASHFAGQGMREFEFIFEIEARPYTIVAMRD